MSARVLHGLAATAVLASGVLAQSFEAPVQMKADGKVIVTDVGHSAPYIYDFDGDGVRDLLVGQFGSGKLRIYRNEGTNKKPKYGKLEWFKAGGKVATVPAS